MKDLNKLLNDMLNASIAIESYAVSSYEAFVDDEKTQDAIMYKLIVLGEAANIIPSEFQEKHPEIPWSSIIGTRNVIVHGYDQVKIQIVWDIIKNNIPQLRNSLKKLV